MSEITAIFAGHSDEGKLEFQTWRAVPVDGTFNVDFGDGVTRCFIVPDELYLNGVREFLYTVASATPIDFNIGKHGKISPVELGMITDNAFLRQMRALESGIEEEDGVAWMS